MKRAVFRVLRKLLTEWQMALGVLWLLACAGLLAAIYFHSEEIDSAWVHAAGYFFAGVGVAPLALLLAYQRTKSLSDQTGNETARRITDAFTKAVELLGHGEVAVRQGGIYALGRLAKEHKGEHPKIMDIVAAYIRQKNPVPKGAAAYAANMSAPADLRVGIDIEAAIAVLRDRNIQFDPREPEGQPGFDLSNCYLHNVSFVGANLMHVNLSDCLFVGCLFDGADLTNANMIGSVFPKSEFQSANLQGALLGGADLSMVVAETLTQSQINAADGEKATTKIPPGLKVPETWQ